MNETKAKPHIDNRCLAKLSDIDGIPKFSLNKEIKTNRHTTDVLTIKTALDT